LEEAATLAAAGVDLDLKTLVAGDSEGDADDGLTDAD
jgi:hypothetical protein